MDLLISNVYSFPELFKFSEDSHGECEFPDDIRAISYYRRIELYSVNEVF